MKGTEEVKPGKGNFSGRDHKEEEIQGFGTSIVPSWLIKKTPKQEVGSKLLKLLAVGAFLVF
ncbi:hypothetical protein E2542_SST18865 [Spatholobus suberectus]|nr:hypothetical protein E2542_SST18865 [Spatholobus suberectus]